jgi:hypothetical protein
MPSRSASLGGRGSRIRICSFGGVASPMIVDVSADRWFVELSFTSTSRLQNRLQNRQSRSRWESLYIYVWPAGVDSNCQILVWIRSGNKGAEGSASAARLAGDQQPRDEPSRHPETPL